MLLTAREHFLVHWILVKRYEINSVGRIKMLFAFNRMCLSDPNGKGIRKNNSRTFERYRIEYIQNISKIISEHQNGEKNSQYGNCWYTNLKTGECKRFKNNSHDIFWVKGKNWFDKQKLYSITTHLETHTVEGWNKIQKIRDKRNTKNSNWAQKVWDEFHNSNCVSINDFYKKGLCDATWVTIRNRFKKYISKYNEITKQGKNFVPNKTLIGVYN